MRVTMIGSGYVGLVSGACFAELGHDVVCVDKDARRIKALRAGHMPIHEPGLDTLVARNVVAGRLCFETETAAAVARAEVVFIAVGTPSRRGDGHADLSYVYAAAREVALAAQGFTVIVTKSTVPVGTGDGVEAMALEARPDAQIAVVSNPEFLREGAAIEDFMRPDRIVVGTDDRNAIAAMHELYRPLSDQAPILVTGRRTAEMIKYAANAFLATKITFINEIADLCESAGAEVAEVARGIGMDRRIGPAFLQAGPGFGGSCFPKDTLALVRTAQEHGVTLRIVESVVAANEARRPQMLRKVAEACGGSVRGRRIGLLGLTFKPDTDDLRESPSMILAHALHRAGALLTVHDPQGMALARQELPEVGFAASPYDCAEQADVLVLATEWDLYRRLDLPRLRRAMRRPVVVDLRNAIDPAALEHHGFGHIRIGAAPRLLRVPAQGLEPELALQG
jgi:UDPglucose 6-dehydrogenase